MHILDILDFGRVAEALHYCDDPMGLAEAIMVNARKIDAVRIRTGYVFTLVHPYCRYQILPRPLTKKKEKANGKV